MKFILSTDLEQRRILREHFGITEYLSLISLCSEIGAIRFENASQNYKLVNFIFDSEEQYTKLMMLL